MTNSSHQKLDSADIQKLASLSRMKISEEEGAQFSKEIDSILSYIDQIQEVSASPSSLLPTSPETSLFMSPDQYPHRNMLREDIAEPLNTDRSELIKLAPESQDGYVKVKKILN